MDSQIRLLSMALPFVYLTKFAGTACTLPSGAQNRSPMSARTAKPNAPDPKDQMALSRAVQKGDIKTCRWLLEQNARVDISDNDRVTPLMHAAALNNMPLVTLLLVHGANPNARTFGGLSPLACLILGQTGHVSGYRAYDSSRSSRNVALYQILLDSGARLNAHTQNGDSLFALAAGVGNREIAGWLLQCGADINETGGLGYTPLLYAAIKDQFPTVRFLLANGADPNREDAQGETPLMAAVSRGNLAIVALLLTKGANVSARKPDGQTALKIAQEQKLVAIVNLLTTAGAKE